MTEPKNSVIKQYKKLFQLDNIELDFEKDALHYIVEKAIEFKLGARGLRSICESIMNDAMYEMPSKKTKHLTITREYAQNRLDRVSIRRLKAS